MFPKSVDINRDFHITADGSGTHDLADCLGNTALLTNHSTHVGRRNMKVQNRDTFFVGVIHLNFDGRRIFYQFRDEYINVRKQI